MGHIEHWERIAVCSVHDEWWSVESADDTRCPYPGCDGPAVEYVFVDHLKGAVERAEKADAEVERLTRLLADTEAELRYAAGLDDDDSVRGQ